MAAQKMLVCLTGIMISAGSLSRASRLDRPRRRFLNLRQSAGVGGVEADENFVGRVQQPCVGLVQHPGSFASKLAELVAVGHVRECPKNQIRTHKVNLLPELSGKCY